MSVAGIDASLTATGIVILRHCGSLVTSRTLTSKARGPQRLRELRQKMIDELVGVRIVALEGYGFGARHSQAHSLGELGGVLRVQLFEMGLPFYVVPPSALKKYVCDKGNAPKDVMIKEVFRRWGFDTSSNDQADAYALARMCLDLELSGTAKVRELMKKVELVR